MSISEPFIRRPIGTSLLAFGLCLASVIGLAFDPNQVAALYFGIPFVALCYLYFHVRHGTHRNTSDGS